MMFTESRPSLELRSASCHKDLRRSSHKFSISKRSAKSINLRFTTRSLMQNIAKRQRNQLARIRDEFVIDKFVDFAIVLYPSAADGKPAAITTTSCSGKSNIFFHARSREMIILNRLQSDREEVQFKAESRGTGRGTIQG